MYKIPILTFAEEKHGFYYQGCTKCIYIDEMIWNKEKMVSQKRMFSYPENWDWWK